MTFSTRNVPIALLPMHHFCNKTMKRSIIGEWISATVAHHIKGGGPCTSFARMAGTN